MALQWIKTDNRTFKFTDGITRRFENAPRAAAWVTEGAYGKWFVRCGGKTYTAASLQAAKRAAENMASCEPPERP